MATQPSYGTGDQSSPENVVKNPGDAIRVGVVLESGIGEVLPGDVFGLNGSNRYAKYDNSAITTAKAIYDGQRAIDSSETADGVVNEGLVFGNAVVDSSDLNVESPAAVSDATNDLNSHFVFDV